jgi:hypothetical protein
MIRPRIIYIPTYSQATGWIVGKMVEHEAKRLTEKETDMTCDMLNKFIIICQDLDLFVSEDQDAEKQP